MVTIDDDEQNPDQHDDAADAPDGQTDTPEGRRTRRSRRTPRGTLSREVLMAAAMQVVDTQGAGAFSMRALGRFLECDPTAMYRHFVTKNALLDALVDSVVRDGAANLPESDDPRADIRTNFRQLRRSLLDHPTLAPLVLRRPPGVGAYWERSDHAVAQLHRAGMDPVDAANVYQTLLFYTLGHTLSEARQLARAVEQEGAGADGGPVAAVRPPADRHPDLSDVAPHLRDDNEAQFLAGLDLILRDLPR
ncbi:TetR/AcrR family transcriptional regulator [Frankia sp. AgB32]|uniref:TetR/AcrR family transcriptional regulator n=1 Tax=Frankia sp. AgB32 TaxID=631119 RepID=UPI0027E2E73C|nr:TetR/AcrR family transcriptional regulator [Frankia sp. AgB32]